MGSESISMLSDMLKRFILDEDIAKQFTLQFYCLPRETSPPLQQHLMPHRRFIQRDLKATSDMANVVCGNGAQALALTVEWVNLNFMCLGRIKNGRSNLFLPDRADGVAWA